MSEMCFSHGTVPGHWEHQHHVHVCAVLDDTLLAEVIFTNISTCTSMVGCFEFSGILSLPLIAKSQSLVAPSFIKSQRVRLCSARRVAPFSVVFLSRRSICAFLLRPSASEHASRRALTSSRIELLLGSEHDLTVCLSVLNLVRAATREHLALPPSLSLFILNVREQISLAANGREKKARSDRKSGK